MSKRFPFSLAFFLSDNDPIGIYTDHFYHDKRQIQIPVIFWKIVFYEVEGELRKVAFLMSQKKKTSEIDFIAKSSKKKEMIDPFSFIPEDYKTYVVNSSLIEENTNLKFSSCREQYKKLEPIQIVIEDNGTFDKLENRLVKLEEIL